MNKFFVVITVVSLACSSQAAVIGKSDSESVPLSFTTPAPSPVLFEVVGTVNLRSCPSTTCGVVGYLYAGQSVEVLGCIGNWCEVVVEKKKSYVYAPCVGQGEGVCK